MNEETILEVLLDWNLWGGEEKGAGRKNLTDEKIRIAHSLQIERSYDKLASKSPW
jgi:hypothetical protein